MGDWGVEPWETDEAADWFHRFWTKGGVPVLIDTIENFDEKTQAHEEVRAAAYLLQVLGIAYVWPVEYSGKLTATLDKAISILNCMIDPPNQDWCYLEMGGDRNELIRAVQEQLAALRKRREALVASETEDSSNNYALYRTDDNAVTFLVAKFRTREEAERRASELARGGHKQHYFVEPVAERRRG